MRGSLRLFNLLCIDFQTKQIVVVCILFLLLLLLLQWLLLLLLLPVHCLSINMHLPLRAAREKL